MERVCLFRRGKRLARSLGSGLGRRGRFSAASPSAAADDCRYDLVPRQHLSPYASTLHLHTFYRKRAAAHRTAAARQFGQTEIGSGGRYCRPRKTSFRGLGQHIALFACGSKCEELIVSTTRPLLPPSPTCRATRISVAMGQIRTFPGSHRWGLRMGDQRTSARPLPLPRSRWP
jgi:hypothetical protein